MLVMSRPNFTDSRGWNIGEGMTVDGIVNVEKPK
jgi:hypothetical protein